MTGGSIATLVGAFDRLLSKHVDEDISFEKRKLFTNDIISATSILMNFHCGWNEIQEEQQRYQTSSTILVFVDSLGFVLGKSLKTVRTECEKIMVEIGAEHINLQVKQVSSASAESCFDFNSPGSKGSICVSETLNHIDECQVQVASSYGVNSDASNIFPNHLLSNSNQSKFTNQLIGLTINNGTASVDIPTVVTLLHDTIQVPFPI